MKLAQNVTWSSKKKKGQTHNMQEVLLIWASYWQKVWEDWVTHIVETLNTSFLRYSRPSSVTEVTLSTKKDHCLCWGATPAMDCHLWWVQWRMYTGFEFLSCQAKAATLQYLWCFVLHSDHPGKDFTSEHHICSLRK